MRISEISLEDGRALAYLVNFLKAGRWDLSGEEADKLMTVRSFVHQLAVEAAKQLKSDSKPTAPSEDTSMKIKNMGPIGSAPKKSKSKK